MRKITFLSIIIATLFISSCTNNTPAELTEEQKAAIGAEVKALYDDVISNLNKMDMDVWSEPWSKNDIIGVHSGSNYFNTYKEFKDSVTYWFSFRESQEVELIQSKAKVFSDNLVLITSKTNWNITFKDGNNMNVDALATLLWKKEDNGWKIIHLHESWQ